MDIEIFEKDRKVLTELSCVIDSLNHDGCLVADASEEDERQYYDNLWERVDEAFEEVFGIKKGETNYV